MGDEKLNHQEKVNRQCAAEVSKRSLDRIINYRYIDVLLLLAVILIFGALLTISVFTAGT